MEGPPEKKVEDDGIRDDQKEVDDTSPKVSKKIISIVVAAILIISGTSVLLVWDYSGDGLANHRQMALIGDVEGDWTEYDSSGDGMPDGTVHELGLNPAEPYPAVGAAWSGGLREDNALAFKGVEVDLEDLEIVAAHVAGSEDTDSTVNYLSENPDHVSALIDSDDEVSELGYAYLRELPAETIDELAEVELSDTSEGFVQSIKEMDADLQKEYIESVLIDGELSEYGVHLTPEMEPEVVSELAPYPLSETTEDFAERVIDLDNGTQLDYIGSVTVNGTFSELGVNATPDLPPEVVDEIAPFELDETSKAFVESIVELELSEQLDYVEATIHENGFSELGVNATPDLPPEVVDEIAPFELDSTGEDLVEYIEREDMETQLDYVGAVIHEDELSELGVYAIPHLPSETVEELSPFELDGSGEDLVEKLTEEEEENHSEYIDAVEVGGTLSELGIYSIPYLAPEGVEIVSPYALDEVGREHVQSIKDMDLDNQTLYTDAVSRYGELSKLGVEYIEELGPGVLENISVLDYGETSVDFAQNLTGLPEGVQLDLAEGFASDGGITDGELNQTYFLNLLKEDGELEGYLADYKVTEKDVSGDGFSNYFSHGDRYSSFIDWDEENLVYAAHIVPASGPSDWMNRHFEPLIEEAEIPEERVWTRFNESATWSEYQNVTDYIAENMTESDLLLLALRGHGSSDGEFQFHDRLVEYSPIAGEVGEIPGFKNALIDSCYGGTGKPAFEDLNDTVTMFSADANNTAAAGLFPGTLWRYMRTEEQEITLSDGRISGGWQFMNSPDLNGDGQVSLKEAFDTFNGLHIPDYPMTPEDYREKLYDEVDDPKARCYPQIVVGENVDPSDFYLKEGLAVDRSDERYDVSHPY